MGIKKGDSIAVDGACMTIISHSGDKITFQAIPETLQKTNFQHYKLNTIVNLETALKIGDKIDGHLVQGHIDCTGEVKNLIQKKSIQLIIGYPHKIQKFLALKGSICINGVSLTISDLQKSSFTVDLIPFTLKNTNLGILQKGDIVNLEIDILARYLDSLLKNYGIK